ncbi:hypothetical protein FAGKG844_570011 [Frankia sp. AgKG'84/4]
MLPETTGTGALSARQPDSCLSSDKMSTIGSAA